MRMITTTAAALLAVLGGGTALAQGTPLGGTWHSSWPSYVEARCAKAMAARRASTPRAERSVAAESGAYSPAVDNVHSPHPRG